MSATKKLVMFDSSKGPVYFFKKRTPDDADQKDKPLKEKMKLFKKMKKENQIKLALELTNMEIKDTTKSGKPIKKANLEKRRVLKKLKRDYKTRDKTKSPASPLKRLSRLPRSRFYS